MIALKAEENMRKTYSWLIIMLLIVSGVFADITITGDARVRPRLDIVDLGEYGPKTENIYYFYRGRILLAADIGDGYYFKTRVGHNGAAYFSKFGTGTIPISSVSLSSAGRQSLSFMEIYFGHQNKRYGWSAGIIPVAHNPLLDMHFYPGKMGNIPWLLYNNAAAPGFDFNYVLAGNKLDLKVLVDNNDGFKSTDEFFVARVDTSFSYTIDQNTGTIRHDTTITSTVPLEQDAKDQYSFDLSYPITLAGFKVTPEFLMTVADEGDPAPMTYGACFVLPKLAGFGASAYYGLTSQKADDTEAYTGWIARMKLVGKLGPGSLTAWYDLAAYTPDDADFEPTKTSFMWISYSYTLHKSAKGSVVMAPTYRLYTQKKEGGLDYSRANIELTTQISF